MELRPPPSDGSANLWQQRISLTIVVAFYEKYFIFISNSSKTTDNLQIITRNIRRDVRGDRPF